MKKNELHDDTRCLTSPASVPDGFDSLVVPVYRASTIVFPTVEAFQRRRGEIYDGFCYGLYGTPTSRALELRIAALEGAQKALVLPSGFAAIVLTTLAVSKTGQRVLFPDNAYETVRPFAAQFLDGLGIKSTFYDPLIGEDIEALLDDDVSLIWVESPGSATLEIQDVPAIVAKAHARSIMVAADNTWATPLRFKPLHFGVDFSVCAVSKYLGGHSDVVMGSIAVGDALLYRRLKDFARYMGYGVSADECSLVLRGIETLAIRLDRSEQTALALARWAAEQSSVVEVRHPALSNNPGHAIWKRDFSGSTGLFSLFLKSSSRPSLARAIEQLELFSIGASWGGTRSVVAVLDRTPPRTASPTCHDGPIVRLSIGMEHPDDLKADLTRMFDELGHLSNEPQARESR